MTHASKNPEVAAAAPHAGRSRLGARAARLEDERLLSSGARYVADIRLPGMVDVAFLRSTIAHGRIVAVGTDAAREAPGVISVVTASDLDGVSAVPDFPVWAKPVAWFPLCRDRVRYAGAAIAAVVADDRYAAEDALELIDVDFEPLPALTTIEAALASDAIRLYDDWPDNKAVDMAFPNPTVDAAFDRLRTVSATFEIQRHGGVPLETRGAIAEFRDGRLTLWSSTQLPHIARTMLHYVLGLPERKIRVIAPDVGGGFGLKAQIYGEEYVVAWLALRLGRPVRWIEDRNEHLVSSVHAREARIELEAAVHEDGRIEALRGMVYADVGTGQAFPNGYCPSLVTIGSLTGPYPIPLQNVGLACVVTNKTPSGAYRGFGIPEAVFARERLIDKIADELRIDKLDLRRRTLLTDDDLPHTSPTGAVLDSGSFRESLEQAVEMGRRAADEVRASVAGNPDIRVGLGIATYTEGTVPTYHATTGHWAAQDSADIRFDPDGGVTVAVGLAAFGQGTTTMVATVAAEVLGVSIDDVRVVFGDTDTSPYGLGAWGSRGTVVAAGAIERAGVPLREKGTRIAAHRLEASPEDIEVADGVFRIRGSGPGARSVTWSDVAHAALVRTLDLPPGEEAGLEARATYDPPQLQHVPDENGMINACATYANSTHAAIVTVDVRTGEVRVVRYAVAHDCGRVFNPAIVAGQVHGGVAQGIGGTLLEEFVFDEDGQPLSASFMDYLLPTACEIPPIELHELESPSPGTPFGAKGIGEAGVIGVPAALAAAVDDALAGYGAAPIQATPITPDRVLELIDGAVST